MSPASHRGLHRIPAQWTYTSTPWLPSYPSRGEDLAYRSAAKTRDESQDETLYRHSTVTTARAYQYPFRLSSPPSTHAA